MPDPVKRRYDATARRERAARTRREVLAAARELLLSEGYPATSVPAVAAAAGVSAEFVYKNVGGRAALLAAVLDVALAGDDAPVAVADRERMVALRAETDPRVLLSGYVAVAVEVQQRVAPLLVAARAAAAADVGAAEVLAKADRERLAGMTGLARHLLSLGVPGELDRVRDVLWTCTSAELHDLLVTRRGWTPAAYGEFVLGTLRAALLDRG
ncbi:transcriptional regulator, TetR family [Klenkia soli]|uniref:Transcriptional regulator, TetR family n=1 Tax=Klenkia soli TaxID=1052260 RepID=A0A1H0NFL5_9ACTN|nr:TetR family transcriptional regulator [Klenkia soli]SDO91499.1 transcriptional regulator, TetR family [Klenkia soli]